MPCTVKALFLAGYTVLVFFPFPDHIHGFLLACNAVAVCTALIQSVIAWAQKSVPPTKATLIYTGEPVWGGVIGCLYGERLTLSSLAGCALVLAGILISERPEKKAGQPAEKAE